MIKNKEYVRRLLTESPVKTAPLVKKRICRYVNNMVRRWRVYSGQYALSWEQVAKGGDVCKKGEKSFLNDVKTRTHLLPSAALGQNGDRIADQFRTFFPAELTRIKSVADQVACGQFDLLGSGLVSHGESIDWHTDVKTGYTYNSKKYHKAVLPAAYPGGADIKVPWELSRFQHVVWMGQAYKVSRNERYPAAFVAQFNDWVQANPVGFGVNWVCTMDVAIRLVNLLWGFFFFRDSTLIDDDFMRLFITSVAIHAKHIMRNLEGGRGVMANNHYIADLAGLLYAGILFPELDDAIQWRDFAMQELEQEMTKQVYRDGVDYESSTSYHRLVTELFLFCYILTEGAGGGFSNQYRTFLERMIEYMMYITRSDGSFPRIGDHDNGRLLRLKLYDDPFYEFSSARSLLAIGAVLFEREDFAQAAQSDWSEAFWTLGPRAVAFWAGRDGPVDQTKPLSSRAFEEAGVYVMRHEDDHMVVHVNSEHTCRPTGHVHNDLLSFELYVGKGCWLIDPGTYVYTLDYDQRNIFRSTAYHNTVRIDRKEQNEIYATDLFRLGFQTTASVEHWNSTRQYDLLCAECLYNNGSIKPLTHRRVFFYKKDQPVWLIRDELRSFDDSPHDVEWFWHWHPSVLLNKCDNNRLRAERIEEGQKKSCEIRFVSNDTAALSVDIEDAYVSMAYGHRCKARQVRCFCSMRKSLVLETFIYAVSRAIHLGNGWTCSISNELKNILSQTGGFD